MNISRLSPAPRHRFGYRILIALLLAAFALGDAAVVAGAASFAGGGVLVAAFAAFTLIAVGLSYTVWHMEN